MSRKYEKKVMKPKEKEKEKSSLSPQEVSTRLKLHAFKTATDILTLGTFNMRYEYEKAIKETFGYPIPPIEVPTRCRIDGKMNPKVLVIQKRLVAQWIVQGIAKNPDDPIKRQPEHHSQIADLFRYSIPVIERLINSEEMALMVHKLLTERLTSPLGIAAILRIRLEQALEGDAKSLDIIEKRQKCLTDKKTVKKLDDPALEMAEKIINGENNGGK